MNICPHPHAPLSKCILPPLSWDARFQAPWNVPPQLALCDCPAAHTCGVGLSAASAAMAKALVPSGALPVNKRCLSCLGHKSVVQGYTGFKKEGIESKQRTPTNANTLDCLTASLCDKFFLGFRIVSHITQFLLDLGQVVSQVCEAQWTKWTGTRRTTPTTITTTMTTKTATTTATATMTTTKTRSTRPTPKLHFASRTVSKSVVEFKGCPWPPGSCKTHPHFLGLLSRLFKASGFKPRCVVFQTQAVPPNSICRGVITRIEPCVVLPYILFFSECAWLSLKLVWIPNLHVSIGLCRGRVQKCVLFTNISATFAPAAATFLSFPCCNTCLLPKNKTGALSFTREKKRMHQCSIVDPQTPLWNAGFQALMAWKFCVCVGIRICMCVYVYIYNSIYVYIYIYTCA